MSNPSEFLTLDAVGVQKLRQNAGAIGIAFVAALLLGYALVMLNGAERDITEESLSIGATPATIFAPSQPETVRGSVVVAHGFAGSQPLMRSIALTLAANGYRAVTFDFAGHGRNPTPLTGALMQEEGAFQTLLDELERVIAHTRSAFAAQPVFLLGHSMASDVVIRAGMRDTDIAGVAAISMFSDRVEPASPRNLLMVSGEWEGFLRENAMRHLPEGGVEGQTYGGYADGTARRAVVGPSVEHLGILYSPSALQEVVQWFDQSQGFPVAETVDVRNQGPLVLLTLAAFVAFVFPLSRLLPRLVRPSSIGASGTMRRLLGIIAVPTILTPLLLWPVPTDILDVMVADYLSLHFALFGMLLFAVTWYSSRNERRHFTVTPMQGYVTILCTAFVVSAFGSLIHAYGANFALAGSRWWVFAAILVGTLTFCLAEERLVRSLGGSSWHYLATKTGFIISMITAIALDLSALFFLIIILPVIVVIFAIHTLYSLWLGGRTGSVLVPAGVNAVTYAWALAATFPMVSGAN